jgi:hypothetical protein
LQSRTEIEEIAMRVVVVAMTLLLSSSIVPAFAQQAGNAPSQSQPGVAPGPHQLQAVPVQPERSPEQSEQARKQDQDTAQDVRVGRDWKAQSPDRAEGRSKDNSGRMMDGMGSTGQNDMAQMKMDHMRMCRQMMESGRGMYGEDREMRSEGARAGRSSDRGDQDRRFYDEGRPSRRVKICIEDENGDEYCRYSNR